MSKTLTRFPQPATGGRHAAEQRASASRIDLVTVDRRRRGARSPVGDEARRHSTSTNRSPDARRVIAPGLTFSDGVVLGAALALLIWFPWGAWL